MLLTSSRPQGHCAQEERRSLSLLTLRQGHHCHRESMCHIDGHLAGSDTGPHDGSDISAEEKHAHSHWKALHTSYSSPRTLRTSWQALTQALVHTPPGAQNHREGCARLLRIPSTMCLNLLTPQVLMLCDRLPDPTPEPSPSKAVHGLFSLHLTVGSSSASCGCRWQRQEPPVVLEPRSRAMRTAAVDDMSSSGKKRQTETLERQPGARVRDEDRFSVGVCAHPPTWVCVGARTEHRQPRSPCQHCPVPCLHMHCPGPDQCCRRSTVDSLLPPSVQSEAQNIACPGGRCFRTCCSWGCQS